MGGKRRRWVGLVLAAVVAAAAGCSSGRVTRDEAGVARPGSPLAETPPTTVAAAQQLWVSPTRGPAGTVVRIEGFGFVGDPWVGGTGEVWLVDPAGEGECVVAAQAEHDLVLTSSGQLSGTFVVPERGVCRFGPGQVNLGPSELDISYGCVDCRIGTFTVTLAE